MAWTLFKHNGNTNTTKSKVYRQTDRYVRSKRWLTSAHYYNAQDTWPTGQREPEIFEQTLLPDSAPRSTSVRRHDAAALTDILQYEMRRHISRHCEAVHILSVFIRFCSVTSLVERGRGEAAPGDTIQGAAKLILSVQTIFLSVAHIILRLSTGGSVIFLNPQFLWGSATACVYVTHTQMHAYTYRHTYTNYTI